MIEKPITLKYADAIVAINPNFTGNVIGNTEEELEINWNGAEEISVADIQAKITEMETAEADAKAKKEADKASAKAKLIAGEALTEEEANTIVL